MISPAFSRPLALGRTLFLLGCSALLCLLTATRAPAQLAPRIEKGQRVFICGDRFHEFIDAPLLILARTDGYAGHATVGRLLADDTKPSKIWKIKSFDNTAKLALLSSKVDVFTLSPGTSVPDKGIELYADLANRYNPNVRVLLPISWNPSLVKKKDPAARRKALEAYAARLRKQAGEINQKEGREMVHLVPVAFALLRVMERIEAGTLPGIKSTSELFVDDRFNAAQPLKNLAAYCWYISVYRRSPIGLRALEGPEFGNVSPETNLVLQNIAWWTTVEEPLNGLKPAAK